MLDIASISTVVAAGGVLVGVVYYLLDVRNQAMIRKTELITKLYSHLYGSEIRIQIEGPSTVARTQTHPILSSNTHE